jgi:cobalt/nickel transport system ATP-binding protein
VKTVLEVTGLNFSFERNRPVLQNIDFGVSEGECLGIAGGNGAGKSTLLWCLLGLLKASGSIRFFGEAISKRAQARIAMVFQNPEDQLFMPALLDDVALPLVNRGLGISEAQRMALDKLDKLGLRDFASRPATKLSIGERKRASIAAALSTSPELLLLDEPTAELDGRSVRQLADLLAQLAVTAIVTSHHLDFLRMITSRTLVLSKGRIIADGPTPDILANQTLLQAADLI